MSASWKNTGEVMVVVAALFLKWHGYWELSALSSSVTGPKED